MIVYVLQCSFTTCTCPQVSHTHTSHPCMHTHMQLHEDTPTKQSTIVTPVTPVFTIGSPEHLTTFVVTTLFDALAGFLYTKEKSQIDSITIWHNVYR